VAGITFTYQWQIRNDTAANWVASNPILAVGEMGYETDTGLLKIGDGVGDPLVGMAWNDLPYFSASGSLTPWPSMTTTEMNAIASPTPGMAVFNETEDQIMVYTDARGWVGVLMGRGPD